MKDIVDQMINIAGEREEIGPEMKDKIQSQRHRMTQKYLVTDRELDPLVS